MRGVLSAGAVITAIRMARGLTQETLAAHAKLGLSTVQRAECGGKVDISTLDRLSTALGVPRQQLESGSELQEALETASEFSCKQCGVRLLDRIPVEHEYGSDELSRFECGAECGWHFRPCPKDPLFPSFDDYELRTTETNDGFLCDATGKTDMARAVPLDHAYGPTEEAAKRRVERSYVYSRYGREAAEAFLPWHELA